jgi:serine/threonine-protein kinase
MNGGSDQVKYYDSLIGAELNRTYRIEEKIGTGGMSAVFRGTHLHLGGPVAIKVISPQLAADAAFVKRFQREARVGWALNHPNIVKVSEFNQTEDGLFFMVMDFVEGGTLSEYLKKSGPLSLERSLEILKPLCEALDMAHKRKILHRDLKPANILISQPQGKEVIKLADFGLAKILQPDAEITKGSNLTQMGEVFGTLEYMSPEQLLGQPVDAATDIYSLGVIVYEMLTGKLPIVAFDIQEWMIRKSKTKPMPPSEAHSAFPVALDKMLLKALATDPEERYQSIGEFFKNFQEATANLQQQTAADTSVPAVGNTFEAATAKFKTGENVKVAAVNSPIAKNGGAALNQPSQAKELKASDASFAWLKLFVAGAIALLLLIIVIWLIFLHH